LVYHAREASGVDSPLGRCRNETRFKDGDNLPVQKKQRATQTLHSHLDQAFSMRMKQRSTEPSPAATFLTVVILNCR
jgi:hypothetical protein